MSLDEGRFQERQSYYKGRAKIYLRHFRTDSSGARTIRAVHVNRLVQVFESEGFARLNPENFIKVSIEPNLLHQALVQNSQTEAALHGPLQFLNLPDNAQLKVLHGNHRLLAAIEKSAQWWVAEFYSNDLNPEIAQRIREEHPNAQAYCDGDIYRHIRDCERRGDVENELKWRGRLSKRTQKQLERMETDFKKLKRALDRLIPFSGLWQDLKLSYLGRWLSLNCPEEIIRYLDSIYQQWSFIMGNNSAALLDPDTVEQLEAMMPGISLHDKAVIEDKMEAHKIFRNLGSDRNRSQVLSRIVTFRGRILSLDTFTRDFIYFEACMSALKPLQHANSNGTMYERLARSYVECQPRAYNVQVSEDSFERRDGSIDGVKICYQQLFLSVMRDFPVLTDLLPYRDGKKAKQKFSGFRLERTLKLAQLASRLGFENDAIRGIHEEAGLNRYQIATEEFLIQLQPPDRYIVDRDSTQNLANYVSEDIVSTPAVRPSIQEALLTTDLKDLPKKLRRSRPCNKDYEHDRGFLFLDIIYRQEDCSRSNPTSFAVQRDIFFCFFGRLDHQSEDYSSANSPDEAHAGDISLETTYFDNPSPATFQSQEDNEWVTESIHSAEDDEHDEPWGITSTRVSSSYHPDEKSQESSEDPLQMSRPAGSATESFETHSISTQSSPIRESEAFSTLHRDIRPSDFISNILSTTNDILLYIWQSRSYLRLSSNPENEHFFNRIICQLRNQQQLFISTRDSRGPHFIFENTFEIASRERLILVGPNVGRSGRGGILVSQLREKELNNFLDRF